MSLVEEAWASGRSIDGANPFRLWYQLLTSCLCMRVFLLSCLYSFLVPRLYRLLSEPARAILLIVSHSPAHGVFKVGKLQLPHAARTRCRSTLCGPRLCQDGFETFRTYSTLIEQSIPTSGDSKCWDLLPDEDNGRCMDSSRHNVPRREGTFLGIAFDRGPEHEHRFTRESSLGGPLW